MTLATHIDEPAIGWYAGLIIGLGGGMQRLERLRASDRSAHAVAVAVRGLGRALAERPR